MRRMIGGAALLVPLVLATPAEAQQVRPNARPGAAISSPGLALGALGDRASSDPQPSKRGKPALFVLPTSPYAEPSGRARTTLFGGWQPNPNTTVGIGLFSVPRSATANQQELRINPMKDPTGKSSRVAAVGLNLAF
ncbi:hypothetical protein [Sphingomonas sp.]|uniref:hypothetical protein n=1 Tax=Sphingomonas sp. TaxID=28214 RepID=UPI002FCAF15A